MKAVLRRSRGADAAPDGEVVEFAGLTIDAGRREVRPDGRAVELSALDFDLLVALARAPGRVHTRRQLLEQVWGWDYYGDERVVDVHIRTLRRALGDRAGTPELIGTVRGVGYKFVGGPV